MYKYKGYIDSSELLGSFPLYVTPRQTRETERTRGVIHVPFARVDTVKGSLYVRGPMHVNEMLFVCKDADIFHDPLREFRSIVKTYVKRL